MVRGPRIDKNGLKKGAWSEEEDNKLRSYVLRYGHPNWQELPKFAGLSRCGRSCRFRWVNHLKPGLKTGDLSPEEEELVTKLQHELGNKWSTIAAKLPGRTDNEIKNYWHTHLKKRTKQNTKSTQQREQIFESSQCGTEQNEQSFEIPELNRENHTTPNQQDSVTIPVCSDDSSSESSSLWSNSAISGGMESFTEQSKASSSHLSAEALDSFWTKPFVSDALYSETNSYVLSEFHMYPYTWNMVDVLDVMSQYM